LANKQETGQKCWTELIYFGQEERFGEFIWGWQLMQKKIYFASHAAATAMRQRKKREYAVDVRRCEKIQHRSQIRESSFLVCVWSVELRIDIVCCGKGKRKKRDLSISGDSARPRPLALRARDANWRVWEKFLARQTTHLGDNGPACQKCKMTERHRRILFIFSWVLWQIASVHVSHNQLLRAWKLLQRANGNNI
jgi:hypothetical protein